MCQKRTERLGLENSAVLTCSDAFSKSVVDNAPVKDLSAPKGPSSASVSSLSSLPNGTHDT